MKYPVLAVFVLMIAVVIIAGCTQGQSTTGTPAAPAPSPAMTASAGTVVATQQPMFTLGVLYLQKSYSFQSEKDAVSEQFYVDDPSWGIDVVITPLNDDPKNCWFEMTVTNMNTNKVDTIEYGRTSSYETHQQLPMYVTGPYKLDMKGTLTKVDVTAAKRKP
jgi:hypothetical protein